MYLVSELCEEEVCENGFLTDSVVTSKNDLKAHEVRRMRVYADDLPSKVDPVGYIDPNKRIKQMVEAGVRVDSWNRAVYDFENGVEEDDGVAMAAERNDWDDLDMLTDAAREKALYHEIMYRMYRKSLSARSGQSSELSEPKKERSAAPAAAPDAASADS